jgi:peptidoglycan/LPS O-acetylase OafA/YrhL
MTSPQIPRIRTLDGWRGIAILLVIVEHALAYSRYRDLLVAHLGNFGVDIFFVISGYIITLRFLEERERSSTINLKSFYWRRAFRILPPLVAYILTLCFLSLFVNLVDFHGSEIIGSLFFFRNYQYAANPEGCYTANFWSLSIEEHFYLVWPMLLLWLGNRRSLRLAVIGAVSCATWRVYYMAHSDSWIGSMFPGVAGKLWRTDTRFDGLMLGCATAILLSRPSVKRFIFHNFPKETTSIMTIFVVLSFAITDGKPALLTYLLVCLALASTLVVEEGLAFKWLNSRLLVWIGTISYSLYIWQQLFLIRPREVFMPLGRLCTFPINIVCTLTISALSFYFLEKPCTRLGKRLFDPR